MKILLIIGGIIIELDSLAFIAIGVCNVLIGVFREMNARKL